MNSKDTPELMASRKNDHIRLCLERQVESPGAEPFARYVIEPRALPEMSDEEISTQQRFLGRFFSQPLLITGMTGGVERGESINLILAEAAVRAGIPMGLGSQKIMLRRPESRSLFAVKKKFPDLFLIGNLGAVSLNYGIGVSDIQHLVDELELNAFALHLNVLQECIQPEGERNFSGLLNQIEELVKKLSVPVVVKEVGAGLDTTTFKNLVECGVAAVDVGGLGGTNWSRIEGMRGDPMSARLGELFSRWGVPTDESLLTCVELKKTLKSKVDLVATGGMRHGLHVAKAVGLGATMVGVGLPFLRAALASKNQDDAVKNVMDEIEFFRRALATALFCSGSKNIESLSSHIKERRDG